MNADPTNGLKANETPRLAQGTKARGGVQIACHVRGSPPGAVFDPPIRRLWCQIMWKIPRGMVWAVGHGPVHRVGYRPSRCKVKLTRDNRKLSRECDHPRLRVYVSNDTSEVYEDRFTRLARDEAGHIQPTLILLGLRLGIEHITSVYWGGLRAALQFPQSVGIAGYVPPE